MAVTDVDAYERAVAKRSLRAGAIWSALGAVGLVLGFAAMIALVIGMRRHGIRASSVVYLSMCGWVVVCSAAARSGWRSVQRARAVLRSCVGRAQGCVGGRAG